MKKKFVVANWKMNKTSAQASAFADTFLKIKKEHNCNVVICPPFTSLELMYQKLYNHGIKLGAQNCSKYENGAYTGEISAEMIKSTGAEFVILGHSERRIYQKESNELINKKIFSALKNNLNIILCVGENLNDKKSGKSLEVVYQEIKDCLKDVPKEKINNILIAYEPIWAIGTGKAISQQEGEFMCGKIKNFVKNMYSENFKEYINVLYGGSVNTENAAKILSLNNIDGILVGGASLDAKTFSEIINLANI